MKMIKYKDFRLDVLDDIYNCLVDKPEKNLSFEKCFNYVSSYYDENNFSLAELFLVEFILFNFSSVKDIDNHFNKKSKIILNNYLSKNKIFEILRVIEDKEDLIHDMLISGIIDQTSPIYDEYA